MHIYDNIIWIYFKIKNNSILNLYIKSKKSKYFFYFFVIIKMVEIKY
jgi:hypothetical protein